MNHYVEMLSWFLLASTMEVKRDHHDVHVRVSSYKLAFMVTLNFHAAYTCCQMCTKHREISFYSYMDHYAQIEIANTKLF